jgi:hypothetical protein
MRRNVRIPAIVVCLCALFCFEHTQAKSLSMPAVSAAHADTTGWILQGELNGVNAYYKVGKCGVFPAVFLKFINTNSYAVVISWDDQVLLTNSNTPIKVNEGISTLDVNPGILLAEDCATSPFRQLLSRPVVLPDDTIQSFVFLNLRVTAK